MSRVDVIQDFIDTLGAKTYLEIGIRHGESFLPIRCPHKIGVDIYIPDSFDGECHEMTSDNYFECCASPFDVAFIDGDHTYRQSLQDALNCLKWMKPYGVILLHDCNPTKPEWATPTYIEASPEWCGEVWKTILTLRTSPDLYVEVWDMDYGIGIVRRGKQIPLSYTKEQIECMNYKDLEENRKEFLHLWSPDD